MYSGNFKRVSAHIYTDTTPQHTRRAHAPYRISTTRRPDRTEPNRTEPNRTEPNRTEPNRTAAASGQAVCSHYLCERVLSFVFDEIFFIDTPDECEWWRCRFGGHHIP